MFSLEQFQMTVAVSVALCNYTVPSTPSTSHPQWSDAHVLSALREGVMLLEGCAPSMKRNSSDNISLSVLLYYQIFPGEGTTPIIMTLRKPAIRRLGGPVALGAMKCVLIEEMMILY